MEHLSLGEWLNTNSTSPPLTAHTLQESGIPDMVRKAKYLEKTYGHYFDHAILFKGLNSAYTEIIGIADRLQQDEQWVPASWASHMYNIDDWL